MKRPRKIRLFGYEIKIDWGKASAQSEPRYMGRNYSHLHEIWCDPDAAGEGQNLLHEILHHIDHRLFLELEEKHIEPLATALTEFIRLNPRAVKFIQERK